MGEARARLRQHTVTRKASGDEVEMAMCSPLQLTSTVQTVLPTAERIVTHQLSCHTSAASLNCQPQRHQICSAAHHLPSAAHACT
jgi:hypothetical protein